MPKFNESPQNKKIQALLLATSLVQAIAGEGRRPFQGASHGRGTALSQGSLNTRKKRSVRSMEHRGRADVEERFVRKVRKIFA